MDSSLWARIALARKAIRAHKRIALVRGALECDTDDFIELIKLICAPDKSILLVERAPLKMFTTRNKRSRRPPLELLILIILIIGAQSSAGGVRRVC